MGLTDEMLHGLPDENLDLAASITLKLFEDAPLFSKAKKSLRCDLKLFLAEFKTRR